MYDTRHAKDIRLGGLTPEQSLAAPERKQQAKYGRGNTLFVVQTDFLTQYYRKGSFGSLFSFFFPVFQVVCLLYLGITCPTD